VCGDRDEDNYNSMKVEDDDDDDDFLSFHLISLTLVAFSAKQFLLFGLFIFTLLNTAAYI